MGVAEWFKREDGVVTGPFDLDTMRGFARAGVVRPETQVAIGQPQAAWIAAGQTEIFREPEPRPQSAAPAPVPAPDGGVRWGKLAAIVIVGAGAVWFWRMLTEPAFDDATIRSIEQSIKTEYAKRPSVRVDEVSLIRKDSRQLSGFVRLTVGGTPIVQGCRADMGTDGKIVWTCSP